MSKLEFTQNDFDETTIVADAINKIDTIDLNYYNNVSDEIYAKQPFFLSVLLGFKDDVSSDELEEIIKVFFLVWEYFRTKPNVQSKKVTENFYNRVQKRNLEMFKYISGEKDRRAVSQIFADDLQKAKSKALISGIFLLFNERPKLLKMDMEKKGPLMIGLKSFIECFETI